MGRRRRYGSGRARTGSKMGRTLVYQILICLVIVFLVIVIKRMDNAMANKALESMQAFMNKDYSHMQIVDSAKAVFSHLGRLPETIESAVDAGRREMDFIPPSKEEALVEAFGENQGDGGYGRLRYRAENELQVYASSGGTVISVSGEEGNKLVKITHGGELETQYAGCTWVYVNPLDKVKKGQLIASVAPGEQACLTFSMWKDKEAVNPGDYIAF